MTNKEPTQTQTRIRRKAGQIIDSVLSFLEANPCSTKQQINTAVKNGSLAMSSLVKQGLVAEIKTNDPTTNRRVPHSRRNKVFSATNVLPRVAVHEQGRV